MKGEKERSQYRHSGNRVVEGPRAQIQTKVTFFPACLAGLNIKGNFSSRECADYRTVYSGLLYVKCVYFGSNL